MDVTSDLSGAAPLLDKGTLFRRPSRAFVKDSLLTGHALEKFSRWRSSSELGPVVGWSELRLYTYPDGFEAVISSRMAAEELYVWRGSEEVRSVAERSASRSRRVLGRFCRFHAITELWTFTFAELPTGDVGRLLENFLKRLRRVFSEVPGPYVFVEELGGKFFRLHLHCGADWGRRFGAVEVCEVCARPALRAKRRDIPPAGSLCLGCLWGHGFVGRPDAGDSVGLSSYLGKYLVKDVGDLSGVIGKQRYRVAKGFVPDPPALFECASVEVAKELVLELTGGELLEYWDSEASGLDMPRVVVGNSERVAQAAVEDRRPWDQLIYGEGGFVQVRHGFGGASVLLLGDRAKGGE